jgi:tetratricopeptide (TPR) repeat protein
MSSLVVLLIVAAAEDEAQRYLEEAEAALAAGDLAYTRAALDDALAVDPENLDALMAAADLALGEGRPTDAVRLLERLLAKDPANDWARLALARALWSEGEAGRATEAVDAVLARHPAFLEGLELRRDLSRGSAAAGASRWQPRLRLGVAAVYDSNLSLDPGELPEVSNRHAGLLSLDGSALVDYTGLRTPLTLIARLNTMVPLTDADDIAPLAPTQVTAGFVGRLPLGRAELALDLRYEELFTEVFARHLQHAVSPTLLGAYALGPGHRLRLLLGADLYLPEESFAAGTNTTLKLALRDSVRLGRFLLVADLGGRLNRGAETTDESLVSTNFLEIDGGLLMEAPLVANLSGLVAVSGQGRRFDVDLRESTYAGLAGVRLAFDDFDLHAEYAYTINLSNPLRSYDRHQLTVGVRAYAQ